MTGIPLIRSSGFPVCPGRNTPGAPETAGKVERIPESGHRGDLFAGVGVEPQQPCRLVQPHLPEQTHGGGVAVFPEEPRQPGNRNPERLRNLCGRQRFAQMSAQILLDPTEQLRSRLRAADPAGEFVQQGVEQLALQKGVAFREFQLRLEQWKVTLENRFGVKLEGRSGRKRVLLQKLRQFRVVEDQPVVAPAPVRRAVNVGGAGRPEHHGSRRLLHGFPLHLQEDRILEVNQQPRPRTGGGSAVPDHAGRHGLPQPESPDQERFSRSGPGFRVVVEAGNVLSDYFVHVKDRILHPVEFACSRQWKYT